MTEDDEDIDHRAHEGTEGRLRPSVAVDVLKDARRELRPSKLGYKEQTGENKTGEAHRRPQESCQKGRGDGFVVGEEVKPVGLLVDVDGGEGESSPDDRAENWDHPEIVLPVLIKSKPPTPGHS